MKRSRFSEEQIIAILKEAEAEPVKTVCARHNVSQGTYYQWKSRYGGMEVEEARRLRALEDENAAKTRSGRSSGADPNPQRSKRKKMVSPSSRRRAAKYLVEEGLSNAAQACRALGLARSTYYLAGQKRLSSQKLERKIIALSEEHPRYGYRRITALMRRKGKPINAKRVQRVRRQAGLQVKERQRRTRRPGPTLVKRLRAQQANQVWSWDLLYDQTEHGRSLRILSLIDEYTKECLALQVGYSLRAIDAIKVLEAAIARYGSPEYLRSDNGPEFIAKAIQDWTKEQRTGSIYITSGSPWEQAHVESFHDKLRDECLNRELFGSLAEARVILEQ